jgi:ABC-type sugar transport system permease subunit
VTLPLLAASVTANTLLCIIGALQSYQLIYVLTGPINPATQVLSLAIFTQGFGGAQGGSALSQGYAASISIVQFVIVMIVALGALTYLKRRETQL